MTLRVGVAGLGTWGKRIHIPALIAHPGVELVGVWGRDPAAAAQVAESFGVSAFAGYQQLLNDVDVVDLAVAPAAQPALAEAAIAAGRHLLMEKPVALDVPTGSRLAAMVADHGVEAVVFVARLFDPARSAWLIDRTAEEWGHGTTEWTSGAFLPGNPFAGKWRDEAGPLMDVAPHMISQLELVLGPIHTVNSATRADDGTISVGFKHESGATSTMLADMYAEVPMTEELVRFTKGASYLDYRGENPDYLAAHGRAIDELLSRVAGDQPAHIGIRQLSSVFAGVRTIQLIREAHALLACD